MIVEETRIMRGNETIKIIPNYIVPITNVRDMHPCEIRIGFAAYAVHSVVMEIHDNYADTFVTEIIYV